MKVLLILLFFLLISLSLQDSSDDFWEEVESDNIIYQEDPIFESDFEPVNEKEEVEEKEEEKTPRKHFFQFPEQEHYYYELLFLAIFVVQIFVFVLGSESNLNLVKKYEKEIEVVNEKQFSKAGGVEKITSFQYKWYLTGREYIYGSYVRFNLLKRHDLIGMMFSTFLFNETNDLITMDFSLKFNLPCIFVIMKEKTIDQYFEVNQDLKIFCSEKNVFRLGKRMPGYIVLTDSKEFIPELFTSEISKDSDGRGVNLLKLLIKNQKYFKLLHYSDQFLSNDPDFKNPFEKNSHILRIQFYLPKDKDGDKKWSKIVELVKFTFLLIDRMATIKMNKQLREKNIRIRTKVFETLKKEKIDKIKEKEKKEKKEKYEKLKKEKEKKKRQQEQKIIDQKVKLMNTKNKNPKLKKKITSTNTRKKFNYFE